MKLLTLYASIFMPLTFAAGIYGMNFEHMPELKWKYSYPVLLSLMLFAAVGMILFFRRKKWL
jgi:magnesium transporter